MIGATEQPEDMEAVILARDDLNLQGEDSLSAETGRWLVVGQTEGRLDTRGPVTWIRQHLVQDRDCVVLSGALLHPPMRCRVSFWSGLAARVT